MSKATLPGDFGFGPDEEMLRDLAAHKAARPDSLPRPEDAMVLDGVSGRYGGRFVDTLRSDRFVGLYRYGTYSLPLRWEQDQSDDQVSH